MNKDRAYTRAFELVETFDLTNITALQVVQQVSAIAEELLEAFAEGRDDKTREAQGWKGVASSPKPTIPDKDEDPKATWKKQIFDPTQAATKIDLGIGDAS